MMMSILLYLSSDLSRYLSLDLTAEIAIIDAGQLADMVVDAGPWPAATATCSVSVVGPSVDELAWNNTPSCVRTQRHVMQHRLSQHTVAFSVDAVVSGDRAAALAHRPAVDDHEEPVQGLREMLSELVIRSALEGDVAVVRSLLSCQYVHVDVADRRGNIALHCASVSN